MVLVQVLQVCAMKSDGQFRQCKGQRGGRIHVGVRAWWHRKWQRLITVLGPSHSPVNRNIGGWYFRCCLSFSIVVSLVLSCSLSFSVAWCGRPLCFGWYFTFCLKEEHLFWLTSVSPTIILGGRPAPPATWVGLTNLFFVTYRILLCMIMVLP